MKMLQKFEHEGLPVEIINLDGRSLFNASQIGDGLYISPSGIRTALSEMEERVDYVLVTNSMIENCPDVRNADIRKLNNRGENFLTESGVYELIIQSRKPEAKSFRRWITREVIPSIRKTGTYGIPQPQKQLPNTYIEALKQLVSSEEAKIEAEKKLALAAPKARDFDVTMAAFEAIGMDVAANVINHPHLRRNNLFRFLRNEKILKEGTHPTVKNTPYAQYAHHFKVILKRCGSGSHDETRSVTLVKASGISFIIGRIERVYGKWLEQPSKEEVYCQVESHLSGRNT